MSRIASLFQDKNLYRMKKYVKTQQLVTSEMVEAWPPCWKNSHSFIKILGSKHFWNPLYHGGNVRQERGCQIIFSTPVQYSWHARVLHQDQNKNALADEMMQGQNHPKIKMKMIICWPDCFTGGFPKLIFCPWKGVVQEMAMSFNGKFLCCSYSKLF